MRILAVTSDPRAAAPLATELSGEDVVIASSLTDGLALLRRSPGSLVLLDTYGEAELALDLLERIVAAEHRVVVLARNASMTLTLEALARGAADVVAWPPTGGDLREAVARSASSETHARPVASGTAPAAILGESVGMLCAYKTLARVAPSGATVLLQGESGTGKEMFARLLHQSSARASGPFVAVNCAAIPEALLESDLFGHEKGAFTGAAAQRTGRFERASGGTLFLDEIGDMSPALQAKILRALQEREIERVGGDRTIPIDVRVVAATHRDLRGEVAAGRFRADLYYRLAVVVLALPPLRERGEDVQLLSEYFIARFAAEHRRKVSSVAHSTLAALRAFPWPGNVRQLANALERAVLLADGPVLLPAHLPPEVREATTSIARNAAYALEHGALPESAGGPAGSLVVDDDVGVGAPAGGLLPLEELERRHIRQALALTRGHLARAAELLGIHRNTLRRKLAEYGMSDESASSGRDGDRDATAILADSPASRADGRRRAEMRGPRPVAGLVPPAGPSLLAQAG